MDIFKYSKLVNEILTKELLYNDDSSVTVSKSIQYIHKFILNTFINDNNNNNNSFRLLNDDIPDTTDSIQMILQTEIALRKKITDDFYYVFMNLLGNTTNVNVFDVINCCKFICQLFYNTF